MQPGGVRNRFQSPSPRNAGGDTGGGTWTPALDALELLWSRAWRGWRPLAGTFRPDINTIAPEELSAFPEYRGLRLNRSPSLADSGRWDVVVVDCAPTADALRMLTLPRRSPSTSNADGHATGKAVLGGPADAAAALMIEALHAGWSDSRSC